MSPHDNSADDSRANIPERPSLRRPKSTAEAKGDAKRAALNQRLSVSFNSGGDAVKPSGFLGKCGKNRSFKPAVPTSEEELAEVEERCGQGSWQLKTLKFINSGPIQKLLISLLLCDVIILFIELYLDASYPSCNTVARDAISCCPANCQDDHNTTSGDKYNDGHRLLGGGGYGYCADSLEETHNRAACDDHKYEGVHKAHNILFGATIAILATFLIEILTLVVTLGVKLFFSRFLYVLDFFVISSSLALEIAFATMDDNAAADVAGLLVVFRLWRFVRIGHGLVSSTHEMANHKMNKLKKYTSALEEEVIRCGGVLPESKWSLGLLEKTATNHLAGDGDDPIKKVKVEIGGRVVNAENLVSMRGNMMAGSTDSESDKNLSSSSNGEKDIFTDECA